MPVLIGKNYLGHKREKRKYLHDNNFKILLLEDNKPENGRIANELTKTTQNYIYKSVDNFEKFISELSLFKPDAILAEYDIKTFDVREALKYAKHYYINVPFIFFGWQKSSDVQADYIKNGADDFLDESNLSYLNEVIKNFIDKKKDEQTKIGTEKKINQEHEVYENLLQIQGQLGVGFIVLDNDSLQPIYVNKTFCSFCGYQPNEILELSTFLTLLETDNIPHFINELQRKEKDKKNLSTFIATVLMKDGKNRDLTFTVKKFTKNHNSQIILIVHDMVDLSNHESIAHDSLVESENRFRALIEDVKDYAIFMIDSDAKIISWNAGAERMLGYKEDEVIWKKFSFLISGRENNAAEISSLFNMAKWENRVEKELWLEKKNREKLWAALTFTKLINNSSTSLNYSVIIRDLTKSKDTEDQLLENEKQLRSLASHLQAVREEERTRIARELHDEFSQMLTALRMDLTILGRMISKSVTEPYSKMSLHEKISSISELLETTIRSTRKIITELRPAVLDELGLLTAIQWQAQEFENRTGIRCKILRLQKNIDLNQNSSTAIFRIFQEALTNVARHSEANNVTIELYIGDGVLTLEITDDGKGMDESKQKDPTSTGILGIRERVLALGGQFEIKSQKGKGTKLIVIIPYIIDDF